MPESRMAAADKRTWEIPTSTSVYEATMDDGAIIYLRRHGNPNGPRLVMSHGNGLAIDLYYPFWSLLVDDFDIFVYDLRNHGWNPVGDIGHHSIPMFTRDHDRILRVIDQEFGKKPKIGVFHSISALASLLSFATDHRLSARVLIDPPLCKPGISYEEFDNACIRAAAMNPPPYRAGLSPAEEFDRTAPLSLPRILPGVARGDRPGGQVHPERGRKADTGTQNSDVLPNTRLESWTTPGFWLLPWISKQ